jgi:phosphate transport system permease protein
MMFFSLLLKRKLKTLRQENFDKKNLSSLPIHYCYCFCLWSLVFMMIIFCSNFSQVVKYFLLISLIFLIFYLTIIFYKNKFSAKNHIEKCGVIFLSITAGIGILITIAITVSIFFESIRFFEIVNIIDFIFGLKWNPQIAVNQEQSVSQSYFGIIPVFLGTLLITLISMLIAVPIGIMSAIYLSFYAKNKTRNYLKPLLEILAGIPTVVYGYFAVTLISPFFKHLFNLFGIEIASESALATGFVIGIMIIPFILSLTDDALTTVPQALKDGSLAMGSTKSEMIRKVILPATTPSIVGAVILAISRAIGETMIVVMAAGLIANLTINPLDSVTTATAQIVTLLVGDQESNSPKTLAAFALAFALFIITFIFNIIALMVIKNYKRKYG